MFKGRAEGEKTVIKITANKLLYFIIIFFPISTILQGFSAFNAINKILMFAMFFLMIVSFFTEKIEKSTYVYLVITVILTVFQTAYSGTGYYNFNMYIYFTLWCVFFLYLKHNFDEMIVLIKNNVKLLTFIVRSWNILVFVSLFFKRSYVENWGSTYFRSFSNAEHRFGSSCIVALTLAWMLIQLTKKKKYYIYIILPMMGLLMCGARTYLAVGVIYLFAMYYMICPTKKFFYWTIIPIAAITIAIILISPIGEKFISTFEGKGYYGYWATLTNGRNLFWAYDLQAFWELDWWHQLVGNGINFVFQVNAEKAGHAIWAHNDVINLLLTNGYIGTIMYFITFFGFSQKYVTRYGKGKFVLVFSYYFIWFFNAMFNMVYTYTCAVLVIPLMLYSLCITEDKKAKLGLMS